MPGDSFSFPVRVRGQVDHFRLLYFLAQLCQYIALPPNGNILGLIIMLRVNTQLTFRQIPDMAVGSVHLIVGTQKLFDRLYFSR